jgi:hypothetical protein
MEMSFKIFLDVSRFIFNKKSYKADYQSLDYVEDLLLKIAIEILLKFLKNRSDCILIFSEKFKPFGNWYYTSDILHIYKCKLYAPGISEQKVSCLLSFCS